MSKIKLTTDHPMSSYGIPVFVDNNNNAINYDDGVRLLRQTLNLSTSDLAQKCGVSPRTVEGWEQGRMPSVSALLLMRALLSNIY